ncbi:hypothetical protein BS333_20970 (plasmid) [Vibrio azureus]|uniref:Uncharacterized protein n=1 Tax=Vibrio azureus NBRC 104587 TaxID=1219077 RepID=U3ANB2_9VIBR|nr:hypothetical protein [Vibrio azureus]AUI88848.1 hypothetical protein BS333_20970 [Vibrio azureus]GAD75260.1 hypothetical protein VAZ01S_023_00270 [Vibrio azureus NBRC 104587]
MFDFYIIYDLFVKYLKVVVHFANKRKKEVAVQLKLLGTASYTAAFVYTIEKGLDFNVLKLTVIGLLVVALAEKLNQ